MIFNEVKLSNKALFDSYLAGKHYNLITYSFANFYLWRNWDPYSWAEINDALVVKSNYLGLDTICVPISSDQQAIFDATETMIATYKKQKREFIMSEVSSTDLALKKNGQIVLSLSNTMQVLTIYMSIVIWLNLAEKNMMAKEII